MLAVLVLQPFIGNCKRANSLYIHFAFLYLEYKQISSRKSNQSRKQYPVCNLDGVARNDIPCFRQRGQKQYPAVYRHLPV